MSHSETARTVKKYSCTICGNSYEDENKKIGVFHVPKKNFAAWQQIIPQLKTNSRLCDRHFDPADIVKGVTVGQNFHPSERWRLLTSALPKHSLLNQMNASSRVPLKELFTQNTPRQAKNGTLQRTPNPLSASTPLSRVCSSSLSTASVNLTATPASSSKSTHRKSFKRLFTTDSRCTNNQQRKRHKSNTTKNRSLGQDDLDKQDHCTDHSTQNITIASPGNLTTTEKEICAADVGPIDELPVTDDVQVLSSTLERQSLVSCESALNEATTQLSVTSFDLSNTGEWMYTEGEFGTSSWRSRLNLPSGHVMPYITSTTNTSGSIQNASITSHLSGSIMTIGSAVPITFLKSESEEDISSSLLLEEGVSETASISAPSNGSEDNIAANEKSSPFTDHVTASSPASEVIIETDDVVPVAPVQLKQRKRMKKIIPPTNCVKCKNTAKRQCMKCQIKELKLVVKEKDKLNKALKTALEKSEKKVACLESKLKHRIEKYRKSLKTEQKRRYRMGKYAMEVASTIADLKEDIVKLTANQ